MMKTKVILRVILFVIIIIIISSILKSEKEEKEISITVLMYEPKGISEIEVLNLASITKKSLVETGLFYGINIPENEIIWKEKPFKLMYNYSIEREAEYLLFISPSKMGNIVFSEAKLVDLSTQEIVYTFMETWTAEPVVMMGAIEDLTLKVSFKSTGKVKIYFTIESDPKNCEVFKDGVRLDNTGDNGVLNRTYWWKKGKYKIKVSRVDYKHWEDECIVEDNPTEYERKAKLEKSHNF